MDSQLSGIRPPAVKTYDRLMLFIMLLLMALGALMIYSSTSVVNPVLPGRDISGFYYFRRHLFTMVVGGLAMFFTYKLNPSLIGKMALPLMIFSFFLLLLVFIPGIGLSAGGARRWIKLWPTTFQPSELVKLTMVIFLAKFMSSPAYNTERLSSFLTPLLVMGVFQVIFMLQPDFGATMSLAFLTFVMLFISGARLKYMAYVMLLSLPVIYKLIMEPYRLKRFTTFLDPWKDPQGSGFQLVQSFIAFGSGGLTGLGLGESKQKLSFLPAAHTDFIFSLMGEEIGFIGVSVVVVFFLVLFIRGISIANRSKNSFVYYLAYGLTMMISLQALINFAVVLGLVPTKGLPLPFMSYGGSALLVNMAAVGILLGISRGEDDGPAVEQHDIKVRRMARRNIYKRKGYRI